MPFFVQVPALFSNFPREPLLRPEEHPRQEPSRNIIPKSSIQRTPCKTRCIPKLIRSRKRNSIRNAQYHSHNHQAQPDKLQPNNRHQCQPHPQYRLHVKTQPKEPRIRSIDLPRFVGGFKDPGAFPGTGVGFVPPS